MALFKKKDKPGEEGSLIDFVVRSRESGDSDKEIIDDLKDKGFGSQKILDIMKKADLKVASSAPASGIEPAFEADEDLDNLGAEEEPAEHTKTRPVDSDIEEIAEKIAEEKWSSVKKELEELTKWKDDSSAALEEMKQKFDELNTNIELFKKQLLERLTGYSDDIKDVSADIKAMDMVFKQILPELTSDVKELSGIIGKLKKK